MDHTDDWDQHWSQYAVAASLNPAQTFRHELVLDALDARDRPVARLLDIGSGQGDFLTRAVERRVAGAYAGFELSDSGIAVARSKLPQVDLLRVDVFQPPPEADRFRGWATAAVCSDVIEHVDDPVGFLRTARAYLAPGARLVLTVPGGPMSAFDRHIGHRRHYTEALARETLVTAGFAIDDIRLAGFPFFNVYRVLVILRGEKLIADVSSDELAQPSGRVARAAMKTFDRLFKLNVPNSRFGWQVVVRARA